MFTAFNKETKEAFKVYSVEIAPTSRGTIFLIFDKQWKWVDAREYVPEYSDLEFE